MLKTGHTKTLFRIRSMSTYQLFFWGPGATFLAASISCICVFMADSCGSTVQMCLVPFLIPLLQKFMQIPLVDEVVSMMQDRVDDFPKYLPLPIKNYNGAM